MIYDVIEAGAADLVANYAADFAAVVAQKGLGGLGLVGTAVIYKRQPAEIFAAIPDVPGQASRFPGLGIYAVPGSRTQPKSVQLRDSDVQVAHDFFLRGSDPEKVVLNAEIAVEAILRHLDRMPGQPGVVGVGEEPRSVLVDMFDVKKVGEDYYEQLATVTAPHRTRDDGL